MEDQATFKSGALTLDGGRSSHSRENTSATSSNKIDVWLLRDPRMKKQLLLESRRELMELTKDGKFSTLIRLQLRLRDLIKILDGKSIDHSTSSQDFQPIELLSM